MGTVSVLKAGCSPQEALINHEKPKDPDPEINLEVLSRLDHIGMKPNELDAEDSVAVKKLKNFVRWSPKKCRYEVNFPWKCNTSSLPVKFGLAN